MDSSEEDIYFQKLQELLEDEDKIVTVSSLAITLNIPVQDSLQILSKYFNDNKKLKPEFLSATYVLTGTLKNNQGNVVCLVKDTDLKSKRDEFSEVSSEIFYSIQKSKDVDFNIVALIDWPSSTEKPKPLTGTVVTKNCTKRILKFKILPPPPVPTIKSKSSCFAPKVEPKSNETSSDENKIHSVTKVNSKLGTITNLFSKKVDNNKEAEKQIEPQKKLVGKDKSGKGTLSSFFSKSSSDVSSNAVSKNGVKSDNSIKDTDSKNSDSKEMTNSTTKNLSSDPTEDLDFGSDIEMKEESVKSTEQVNVKKNNNSSNIKKDLNKSSKRAREKSSDKSNKRRKRIIQSNDSDSDDIFGNDENEEDNFEKSDDEPKNPSPAPAKPLAPKNKKRVAVDRSYIDEEGFMVTKKEYIYESASEEESDKNLVKHEIKEEKQLQKSSEKKSSASSENNTSPRKVGKGKKAKKNVTQNQPTLMNFFTKK